MGMTKLNLNLKISFYAFKKTFIFSTPLWSFLGSHISVTLGIDGITVNVCENKKILLQKTLLQ